MTSPGSSRRYESQARAAAYKARNPARDQEERALLSALLARGGQPPSGPVRSILDAPCGTGRLYPLLRQTFASATYIGLDGSQAMLDQARTLVPAPLLRGDLLHLPFGERSFDLVLSFRFLHHLPAPAAARALEQLARRSRSDLVVSAFHPWSTHHFSRRLRSWLRRRPIPRHAHSPGWVAAQLQRLGLQEVERARIGHLRDLWVGLYRREGPERTP